MTDDALLLSLRGCDGTLERIGSDTAIRAEAEVAFNLNVDQLGGIDLDFEEQPLTGQNVWLLEVGASKGREIPRIAIKATFSGSKEITSDRVILHHVGTRSTADGERITLRATAHQMRVTCRTTAREGSASYLAVYQWSVCVGSGVASS